MPFKKGNKDAEKWTEEIALELGNDLIDWLSEKDNNNEDKGNIFFEDFLIIEKGLYRDLIKYLCDKFPMFFELIKRAKEIQELKLIKFGIADRLQPTMTIFVLKNHHNYKDKSEVENTIINKLTPEQREKRIKELETKRAGRK